MKKQLIALLVLGGLTGGSLAWAVDQAPSPTKTRGPGLFLQADADQDGKLSPAEFATLQTLQQQRMAQREAKLPQFADLDTQNKGYITLDQLRQAHQAMMQDDESMVCPKGLMGGRHAARWDKEAAGRGAGGQGRPEPSLFEQADKDANGQLSASEYATLLTLHQARMSARQAARGDFKTLDGNGDGFITPDELRRARPAAQN